jgi:hypothetical protein
VFYVVLRKWSGVALHEEKEETVDALV